MVIKKVTIDPSELGYLAKNSEIISVTNQESKLKVEIQIRDNIIPVLESLNILVEEVDE